MAEVGVATHYVIDEVNVNNKKLGNVKNNWESGTLSVLVDKPTFVRKQ